MRYRIILAVLFSGLLLWGLEVAVTGALPIWEDTVLGALVAFEIWLYGWAASPVLLSLLTGVIVTCVCLLCWEGGRWIFLRRWLEGLEALRTEAVALQAQGLQIGELKDVARFCQRVAEWERRVVEKIGERDKLRAQRFTSIGNYTPDTDLDAREYVSPELKRNILEHAHRIVMLAEIIDERRGR